MTLLERETVLERESAFREGEREEREREMQNITLRTTLIKL